MRFCEFLTNLYRCFPCSNQGQFVLEAFSALCGEIDPVNSNKPGKFTFSDYLPSGLSGIDATSRKRLYGNSSRYNGLTTPIKKHIRANSNKNTFVAYCEVYVSMDNYKELCTEFNVSSDISRSLLFEAFYEQFLEFAKATNDSTPDTFVSDFVTEKLMNQIEKVAEAESNDALPAPLCAGDDICLVRQSALSPHTAAFYDKLTHYWVIKNSGMAVWDGRYMEFVNNEQTPLKMDTSRIEIEKTPPGGEVTITIQVEARHIEGTHEIVLDMKDCQGRLCFPDKRAELRLPVTVGWKK